MTVEVKITTDRRPFFNGRATGMGETIEVTQDEADLIVDNSWGEITAAPKKKKRARDASGRLKGDDKSTPHINEAWEIED
tara:strand:- start:17347 stop:17586 length:240 start_codon:yes stop_codon:yes gene_type:complete